MNPKDIVRQARRLWSNPDAPASTNRHNRRSWVRSVLRLGPNWVLSQPVNRPAAPSAPTWRKP
jgi:hypothetical protein